MLACRIVGPQRFFAKTSHFVANEPFAKASIFLFHEKDDANVKN